MKERPILFSGEMVRAILDGRKTQTRRVVKINGSIPMMVTDKSIEPWNGTKEQLINAMVLAGHRCKYGRAGDRLWVKETHFMLGEKPIYRASCQLDQHGKEDWWVSDGLMIPDIKWKPSIFMRRKHSRITLEIVSVRVERLKHITHEDCIREGCKPHPCQPSQSCNGDYERLWESINGAGSWDANPWVWVIEFKKCENA
jgi:hypothetical protein